MLEITGQIAIQMIGKIFIKKLFEIFIVHNLMYFIYSCNDYEVGDFSHVEVVQVADDENWDTEKDFNDSFDPTGKLNIKFLKKK